VIVTSLAVSLGLLLSQDLRAAELAWRTGDYKSTVLELQRLDPSAEVEYFWANLYYECGLPALALEHVDAGLLHEPAHLGLLHRATSTNLWLGEPEATLRCAEELAAAIAASSLSANDRPGWESAVEDFRQRATELGISQEDRDAAVLRSQFVAAGIVILGLGLLIRVGT